MSSNKSTSQSAEGGSGRGDDRGQEPSTARLGTQQSAGDSSRPPTAAAVPSAFGNPSLTPPSGRHTSGASVNVQMPASHSSLVGSGVLPGHSGALPSREALGSTTSILAASQSLTSSFRVGRRGERGDGTGGGQPVVIVEPEGYEGDDRFSASRSKRVSSARTGSVPSAFLGNPSAVPPAPRGFNSRPGSTAGTPLFPSLERSPGDSNSRKGHRASGALGSSGGGRGGEGQLSFSSGPAAPPAPPTSQQQTPSSAQAYMQQYHQQYTESSTSAIAAATAAAAATATATLPAAGRGASPDRDAPLKLQCSPYEWALNMQLPDGHGNLLYAADASMTFDDPAVYTANAQRGTLTSPIKEGQDCFFLSRTDAGEGNLGAKEDPANYYGGKGAMRNSGCDSVLEGSDSALLDKALTMGVGRSSQGYQKDNYYVYPKGFYSPIWGANRSSSEGLDCGCCVCAPPRDPRTIFCLGFLLLVVAALISPILCVSSLHWIHHYTNTTLPRAVNYYTQWHMVKYHVDNLEVTTLLYSYFGERLPPLMTVTAEEEPAIEAAWQTASFSFASEYARSRPKFLLGFSVDKAVTLIEEILNTVEVYWEGTEEERKERLSSITSVRDQLVEFKDGVLLEHISSVTEHQTRMSEWGGSRWLRDEIGNTFYTTEVATTMARTSSLLQAARLSCYRLPSCWDDSSGSGGRQTVEEIELLAGLVTGTANNILNEVLATVADPKGDATTLEELVIGSLSHTKARAALLEKAEEWFEELEAALEPYRTSPDARRAAERRGGTNGTRRASEGRAANTVFAFAIRQGWADELYETVQSTLEMGNGVHSLYETNSPITDWLLTGADTVLQSNPADEELLRASTLYDSVFGYKVGESLVLSFTEEEAEEYKAKYDKGKLKVFFDGIMEIVREESAEAFDTLEEMTTMGVSRAALTVDKTAKVALLLGILFPLLPVVFLAVTLRFRVVRSPFPFPRLLGVLFICYIVVVAFTIAFYVESTQVPRRERAFTGSLLLTISNALAEVLSASSLMVRGLQLSLLIAGSIEDAEADVEQSWATYEEFRRRFLHDLEVLNSYKAQSQVTGDWLTTVRAFLVLLHSTLEGGFDPLRQQYTRATSAQLTTDMLNELFHMPGVKDVENAVRSSSPFLLPDAYELVPADIQPTEKSCWAVMSGAAGNALSSTFMSIVGLDEALYSTTVSLNELDRSNTFTHASLKSACFAFRLAAAADPNEDEECFSPVVCNEPSDMGLLRSVDSGQTIFNVFNPQLEDCVGEMLTVWRQTMLELIPHDINALLDVAETSADGDAHMVLKSCRLIIWGSVILSFLLQCIGFATYTALFGESFFGQLLS